MTALQRVGAAIDIGSNSVHLLVAAIADGPPLALRDESELLGLGAVVDLEGTIPEPERAAAIDALASYVAMAAADGAEWITLLATEPLRRAANRSRFCDEVERAVGRPLHVLSHEEEAVLTLIGVLGSEEPTVPTLVIDIGGGSSEVVLYGPGEDPVVGSIPVGSARLTGAFIEDDPPTAEELAAIRAEARRLAAGLPVGHPVRGIVVGGSGRNLLRLVNAFEGASMTSRDVIDAGAIERAVAIVAAHPSGELWRVPACASGASARWPRGRRSSRRRCASTASRSWRSRTRRSGRARSSRSPVPGTRGASISRSSDRERRTARRASDDRPDRPARAIVPKGARSHARGAAVVAR